MNMKMTPANHPTITLPRNAKALTSKAKEVSRVLRGFSHPTRLRILCRLADGPAPVSELQEACGLSQAQTSQFLARLKREGQVNAERNGQSIYYSLNDSRAAELIAAIAGIYCKTDPKAGSPRNASREGSK